MYSDYYFYLIIAIASNGWVNGVFKTGNIGHTYISKPMDTKFGNRSWFENLMKPLYGCTECVAGQWSLWFSIYKLYHDWEYIIFTINSTFELIVSIAIKVLFTIAVAMIIYNKTLR